jgi:NADH-quinone oxidoreductase subunit K
MVTLPMEIQLLLAGLLFLTGLVGLLVRRNIIFMLMSIEIMLNSAGMAFVIAGSHWMQVDGQVMFIFILTVSAAEVSVGLALILQMYRSYRTLDADAINKLHDTKVSENL